jgi:hypothetical protein
MFSITKKPVNWCLPNCTYIKIIVKNNLWEKRKEKKKEKDKNSTDRD